MLRRSNYDLVDEDGYDMRIPAVSEEAFQYGIIFKLKYVGSLDIPKPSSRTDIISAMRRIRCEYKLRSAKKKKVVMIVSVDGIKTFARKAKAYSSRRLLTPFLRRDHSASSVLSTPSNMSSRAQRGSQQLTRASSAAPLSSASLKSGNNSIRSCATEPAEPTVNTTDAAANNELKNKTANDSETTLEASGSKMTASMGSMSSVMLNSGTGLPEDEPPLFLHPIHRIFFVSHYSPDERVFSYIARNTSSSSNNNGQQQATVVPCPFTCYVFKTYKKSEAIRIVRTIGQSFEVCHNISQKLLQKQQKLQQASSSSSNKNDQPQGKPPLSSQPTDISSAINAALNYAGSGSNNNNNNNSVNNTPGMTTQRSPQQIQPSNPSPVQFPTSNSLYDVAPDNNNLNAPNGSVERSQSLRLMAAAQSSSPHTYENSNTIFLPFIDAGNQPQLLPPQSLMMSAMSTSLSAGSTLTTMSPNQMMTEGYTLADYNRGFNSSNSNNDIVASGGVGGGAHQVSLRPVATLRKSTTESANSSDGTCTNDEAENNNLIGQQQNSSPHLLITNNASNSQPSPLVGISRLASGVPSSLFGSGTSSDARMAVFQRMLELQRQENEASLAQAERLRQQLLAECDARQAAQQRNYQLLRQNCELVDKLTQLFDRLERVEKSLVTYNTTQPTAQAPMVTNRLQPVVIAKTSTLAPSPQTSSLLDDLDVDSMTLNSIASTNTSISNQVISAYRPTQQPLTPTSSASNSNLVPKISPPPPKALVPSDPSKRRSVSTWQQHRQATSVTVATNSGNALSAIDNNLDNIISKMMHQEQQILQQSPTTLVDTNNGDTEKQTALIPISHTESALEAFQSISDAKLTSNGRDNDNNSKQEFSEAKTQPQQNDSSNIKQDIGSCSL